MNINKIVKFATTPEYRNAVLSRFGFYKNMSDREYLSKQYKLIFNKTLDLDTPRTFNEKIQWLKLNDRKDIYTKMADKYEAKNYVKDIIGERYIIKTLGVYNHFDEIDFSSLPNKFVIKCTHDSGGISICKDKNSFNIKKAKRKIERSLKVNFYLTNREWVYKNIQPRIIVEEYMEDIKEQDLKDYKFFCFNGNVEFFKIDFDRYTNHGANYYDKNGKLMPFGECLCPPNFDKKLNLPSHLNEMIKLANILSNGTKFLRVDFYEINGKVYFGELTFYPSSGFGKFTNEEWDLKLGDLIEL